MRKWLFFPLFLLFFQSLQADIQPAEPPRAQTDSVAARILDLHLKARGGPIAFESLESLIRVGQRKEGQRIESISLRHRPPFKVYFQTSHKELGWEHKAISIYNGQNAWHQELSPERRPLTSLPVKEAKLLAFEADLPTLVYRYKTKGYSFQYIEESSVGERKAFVLRAHLFPDFSVDIFFDAQTFLILNYRYPHSFAGKIEMIDRLPTRMKRVDGIWFAHGYDFRLRADVFASIEFTDIQVNPQVDPALFLPK